MKVKAKVFINNKIKIKYLIEILLEQPRFSTNQYFCNFERQLRSQVVF